MQIIEDNNHVSVKCDQCDSLLKITESDVDFVPASDSGKIGDVEIEFLMYSQFNILCPCCCNLFMVNDCIPTAWMQHLYFEFYE